MCLSSQETNGWCEESTYEKLRKALVDLTKKTAERSKLNWVEMEANPGHLARAPSALATVLQLLHMWY